LREVFGAGMRKAKKIFWAGLSILIVYWGVADIDSAKTGVELIRGFFWLAVGCINLWGIV
jgi:hypothetical protein